MPKDNYTFVKWALEQINNKSDAQETTVFLAPDAGATHKIYKVAESVFFKGSVVTCTKERDNEGKLSKVVVPKFDLTKDVVIIDDICDGGRTFINIAKAINVQGHTGKIYLVVTHGIFSAGFTELKSHFDGIYCTNSYSNILDRFTMSDAEDAEFEWVSKNVKQFNVF